jgi:hypothetical protein
VNRRQISNAMRTVSAYTAVEILCG